MGNIHLIFKTVATKGAQPQKPPWRNVNLVHDKIWGQKNLCSLQTPHPIFRRLCFNWNKHTMAIRYGKA